MGVVGGAAGDWGAVVGVVVVVVAVVVVWSVVVGGVVVVGSAVVVGASRKATPGSPVVAGGECARLGGGVDVVEGRVVVAGLDVVDVVEVVDGAGGGTGVSAAGRPAACSTVDGGSAPVRVGRVTLPAERPPVGAEPRLAALTNATRLMPAARNSSLLTRAARLWPYHHTRTRSPARGRWNAPLVLMPE